MKNLGICIPSYNYGHYLGYAIESCLNSSEDFDLIVLDNASTDSTSDLKDRYRQDRRLTWVRNETLLPVQENWNKAVSLTKTKWVKLLQADDCLASGAVKRLCQIARDHSDQGFHAHLADMIDADGVFIRRQSAYSKTGAVIKLQPLEGLSLKLKQVARLKEPTCNMFRKDAWDAIGGYDKRLRFTFDIAFNVELMARYPGMLWSESLASVRRHRSSDGARLPADLALSDLSLVIDRILKHAPGIQNRILGDGLLQYRLLELFLQKARYEKISALGFLWRNRSLTFRGRSWFHAIAIAGRKLVTGDVQKTLD